MVKSPAPPMPFPSLLRGMRLAQLQLVRMAGRGANFREMADALHVTQPAITKMAQELERALGAPVFERSSTGVRLNAFGRALLSQVQRAMAHLDQLAEDLPAHREGVGAALRIGSPSFTAAALLAGPVAQWLSHWPGGRVVMADGVSGQLLTMLRTGEVDAVIGSVDDTALSDDELQRLHFEPLYDDAVSFVTSTGTPGLDGPVELSSLAVLPWIMPPRNSQVWMALRRQLALAGQALPQGAVETTSIPAIGAILRHAPGTVGALRADAGRHLATLPGLRLLSVSPGVPLPQVGIVRMRPVLADEALDALLDMVRQDVARVFGMHGTDAPASRAAHAATAAHAAHAA